MNTVLFFGFCNSGIGAGVVIMYLHGKDKTTQCTYVPYQKDKGPKLLQEKKEKMLQNSESPCILISGGTDIFLPLCSLGSGISS